MLCLSEGLVDIAAFFGRDITNVAVQFFTSQRCAGLQRFFGVLHRWQWLIFDVDRVASVLCDGAVFRNHCGDGCTGGVNGAASKNRMRRYLLARKYDLSIDI